jgi:pimeloyl-ACP methyl ester carboxylesterase
MQNEKGLSRRDLLAASAVVAAGTLAVGEAGARTVRTSKVAQSLPRTFAMSDGSEIYCRSSGTGGKGLALFVHPIMHDSTIWLDQLRGLNDLRQCIAVDLRGHGKSDPNPNPSVVDSELVKDLVELIDALPKVPIDLVGLAFGGNLCALTYEQRPERIRSITMISSNFDREQDAANKRYTAEMGRMAVIEGKEVVFRRYNEYIVAPGASLFVRARFRSILERTPTETMVAFLNNKKVAHRPDLPAKIKVPVFIPVGESDRTLRMAGPLSQIPNLHTQTLKAAGRLLPIEAPEELNAAIRGFWQKLG